MYEGQFETGQDFAWHWVNEICEETKNIPSWVTIDYEDIWVNKLSNDYEEIDCYGESTFGHIFNRKDFPKYDDSSTVTHPYTQRKKLCIILI